MMSQSHQRLSAPEIVSFFTADGLNEGESAYLQFAAARYEWLLARIRDLAVSSGPDGLRVLDIGPSFQTELLRDSYPTSTIDTLGLRADRRGPRTHERHWTFDLNDLAGDGEIPALGQYDIIVMGEVVEHLYTSPRIVLRGIADWMRPGASLVVQTPNAVALHKRLLMLAGRHPFGPISESRSNPLHFREYTVNEIAAAGIDAGLRLIDVHTANYFSRGTFLSRVYNAVGGRLPPSLRAGISVTFQRPATESSR